MRNNSLKTKLFAVVAILPMFALAACAVVGSSPVFDENVNFLGCQSTLGSYNLPKSILHIVITKKSTESFHVLNDLTVEPIPDRHVFCLDHLRSPTSSDEVSVFKNKITSIVAPGDTVDGVAPKRTNTITHDSTPYLQLIASKAVDHTAGIIRRFIRAAFILLTNRGNFSPARSTVNTDDVTSSIVVADFKVDPFDHLEMASVNETVRKFGFCFILEDYTFDRDRNGGSTPNQYCSAPMATVTKKPPQTAAAIQQLHYLVPKPVAGIFFRPRAPYRVSVYAKADPEGRGVWRPGLIKSVQFENIMPIVSVGVSRAIFATRRTGLVFNDGMLTSVCISKGSEAESAVQIPLDVIYGIIALPSEMILGAIDDASTARQLLKARNDLVTAQNNYIKFLGDQNAPKVTAGGGDGKGKLTLGDPKGSAFPEDIPPDADPIIQPTNPDALADVCPELFAVKVAPKTGTAKENF